MHIYVTMPDSSEWKVPVGVVTSNRNAYYKTQGEDVSDEELDDFDLADWARNNMNWSDVVAHATQTKPSSCDFQEGWTNGEMNIR